MRTPRPTARLQVPWRALLPALMLALLTACGGGGGAGSEPPPVPGLVLGQVPAPWLLADLNPASPSHAQAVGPVPSQGRASTWYFGHATWGYCQAQFGHLDTLCTEIEAENPSVLVDGCGTNEAGYEAGNATIMAGRTLAWTQDAPGEDVWALWQVTNRDCVVLDRLGRVHAVVNLTANDLGVPANYAALKAQVLAAHAAAP